MQQIGIFGGTFDPPHIGHLVLAEEALDQLGLERLLWVLTPAPPHKQAQAITPVKHRLAMLEQMLSGLPRFELSRVEIDRPAPQYTVDTVHLLQTRHPDAQLTLLIGGDSLRDLPTWEQPGLLVAAVSRFGVMRRPGDSIDLQALESVLPGLSAKVRFFDAPLLEIASKDIRQRIQSGKPFRSFLHPGVYEYIQNSRLYR